MGLVNFMTPPMFGRTGLSTYRKHTVCVLPYLLSQADSVRDSVTRDVMRALLTDRKKERELSACTC